MARSGRARTSAHPLAYSSNLGHSASAYEQIREAIFGGVLRPMERITEGQVAARLGLSRTPVREAFGLLAAEGLIVIIPRRGSFVSQLSIEDILEIYQIRTPLECAAARVAAETMEPAVVAELEKIIDAELGARATRAVRDSLAASAKFHRAIVACSRNKRLEALLMQLQSQVHRARMLWPSTSRRLDETWKEHVELLQALKGRDPDAAERLMRRHLERAQASTVDRMLPTAPGTRAARPSRGE